MDARIGDHVSPAAKTLGKKGYTCVANTEGGLSARREAGHDAE